MKKIHDRKPIKKTGRILPTLIPIQPVVSNPSHVAKIARDITQRLQGAWWFPSDSRFRDAFTATAHDIVVNTLKHGDLRNIENLVDVIPDIRWREQIREILAAYVGAQIKFPTRKLYWESKSSRPKNLPVARLDLFNRGPKYQKNGVILGQLELSVSEFVDEVTDLLVLHRNKLGDEHIDKLAELILQLVERRQKRRAGQDLKAEGAISTPAINTTIRNDGSK